MVAGGDRGKDGSAIASTEALIGLDGYVWIMTTPLPTYTHDDSWQDGDH